MSGAEMDLRARLERARAELHFGEVAIACGLGGCTRLGWDCPACRTLKSVRERKGGDGARCSMTDCRKGFDLAGLVMSARGVSVLQAATFLDRLIEEKAAGGNAKAPGLFGGENG